MKVTTDACLFGAWVAQEVKSLQRSPFGQKLKVKSVLDIGTGTGLLTLMLAQKNGSWSIDAIEIDNDACEQARENAAGSPFAGQLHVMKGDVKKIIFTKQYDLIISNPPFYEKEITSGSENKNLAHHHAGLLLDELLSLIKMNLSPSGIFYLLLPYKRNEEIKRELFAKDLSILKLVLVRQSTKHDYFRIILTGKLRDEKEVETIIDEISIWNDEQQYTDEFIELLKDYYLYL
jgi:tRNA1Val (adenine37-N6)-methyltransferase